MKFIDADELIARHARHIIYTDYDGDYTQTTYVLTDDIERFEKSDVQAVKRGFWIDNYCSVCGQSSSATYKFCPYCGAKME